MNPWANIDSAFELDRCAGVRETEGMTDNTIQYLVLDRRDPDANMARFYVLSIEESLFGDASLIREWGRIGTKGQRRVELHASHGRAAEALETWLRRKRRRGYKIRQASELAGSPDLSVG
jgi:predicted DNA-binding WGR domain protein